MEKTKSRRGVAWSFAAALLVVLIMVFLEFGKSIQIAARGEDLKPTIDFTWTPIGRVSLREMVAMVRLEDDFALDFKTFKIRIVELDRELDIVRDDIIGRKYEDRVSFAMFDGNAELLKRGQMTVEITVADDRGQVAKKEWVIKLKREAVNTELIVE